MNELIWVVVIFLIFIALQVWLSNPWATQRILTVFVAIVILTYLPAIFGNTKHLNMVIPVPNNIKVSDYDRSHVLKLKVLGLFSIITISEAMMLLDAPLSMRVVTLSLLPIPVHYLMMVTARLTFPMPEDE